MTSPSLTLTLACLALALVSTGCSNAPGKPREPGSEQEAGRPEQVASFAQLYKQSCAGCHGAEGRGGAAISLANPVYLATAGEVNIQRITSEGVAGTMMPALERRQAEC